MKQAEDNYKKAQALVYSQGNLTLLLLGPRYWMPSVYLIKYSISSTETPGKSFLPLRRKRNGASVRERSWPRWCKVLRHHGHSAFTTFSPPCHRLSFLISLAKPVRFRDTAASETQQPRRHSSGKSSTLFFKFCA